MVDSAASEGSTKGAFGGTVGEDAAGDVGAGEDGGGTGRRYICTRISVRQGPLAFDMTSAALRQETITAFAWGCPLFWCVKIILASSCEAGSWYTCRGDSLATFALFDLVSVQ